MRTGSSRTKGGEETGNHGIRTHPPVSGTPRKRRNHPESKTGPIMARNDHLDYGLRQRLRNVSTEQNPNTQAENPAVPYHHRRRNFTLPKNSDGPDYRITETQRERRHPYHHRPRMLKSHDIPPLLDHDHWTQNRAIIHGPSVAATWLKVG